MSEEGHPSFFALDRRALGDPSLPSLQPHLDACDRCRAHLLAVTTMPAAPAWLATVERAPRRGRRRFAALSLVAALGAVMLFARSRETETQPNIAEKGGPEVAVHLKRGATVSRWDGRALVRVGDRLRLQIRGGGFRFVSVAVPAEPGQAPRVMYAGPLSPVGATLLPLSFRVDESAALEILDVIVGLHPPAPEDHAHADLPRDAWRQQIKLEKEPR